jgi:hypothetical protein
VTASPPLVEVDVGPDESLSSAVVRALDAVFETRSVDLPPLYRAIDPDTLDDLFPAAQETGRVTFAYEGYLITAAVGDAVAIRERSSDD